MLAQGALDLAELDPEAPDLDLLVDPAQVLDVAVFEPARQVAGLVEAPFSERIVDELLGIEFRAVEITPRHLDPADAELTGYTHGLRVAEGIEDIELGVGYRLADGDDLRSDRRARVPADVDGRLGGGRRGCAAPCPGDAAGC